MANKHPNTSGLKPFKKKENCDKSELEKQTEANRNGGIKSGEVRNELKTQKQLINLVMENVLKNGKTTRLTLIEKAAFLALNSNATIKEVMDFLKYDAQLNGEFNENQVVINNNQKELTKEELKELYKKMKE